MSTEYPSSSTKREQINVIPTELIYNKKQFRAPFKVFIAEWNPCVDLLALASKKGEVVVKRPGWKKCWKLNVQNSVDPMCPVDPEESRSIQSLVWSPQGDVLAIGMDDGHIHLIEVDLGVIKWTKKLQAEDGIPPAISRLRWYNYQEKTKESSTLVPDESEEHTFLANLSQSPDDTMKEMFETEKLYRNVLQGTLLFAIRDDNKVTVLAGGICPILTIDIAKTLESLMLYPVMVYDVLYSSAIGGISISVTSQGPRPHCGGAGTFGVPVLPPSSPVCAHTHVFNMELGLKDANRMWLLVSRYLKLHNRYHHVATIAGTRMKDWDTMSQIFVNRVMPTSSKVDLGETLICYLLSGVGTPLAEAYIERTIQQAVQPMKEFLDNNFTNLVKTLKRDVANSVRCLAFQLEQVQTDLELLTFSEVDCNEILFPSKNKDVNVYPFDSRIADFSSSLPKEYMQTIGSLCRSMEVLSVEIQAVANRAAQAASANLHELQTLTRWLALFPVVMKSQAHKKGPLNSIYNAKKINHTYLLKYMIETFVNDKDLRKELLTNALNFDTLLENQRNEEENPDSNIKKKIFPIIPKEPEPSMAEIEMEIDDEEEEISSRKGPNMIKLNSFWADELGDEVLTMLNIPIDSPIAQKIRKDTLTSCYKKAQPLIVQLGNVIGQLAQIEKMNWVCEIESDPSHTGYNSLSFSRCSEIRLDGARFGNEPIIGDTFLILAHSNKELLLHVVQVRDNSERYSGIQDDLKLHLSVGTKLKDVSNSSENIAPRDDELRIVIPNDNDGEIEEISDVKALVDGTIFVLVKTKSETLGEVKRLLKGHAMINYWRLEPTAFRLEQFESMHFATNDIRACSIYDNATRVMLFSTTLPEETDFDSKQREQEEYRLATELQERVNRILPAYFHAYDGNQVYRIPADDS